MGQSKAVSDPDRFRRKLFIGVSYRVEETAVTRTDRRVRLAWEISARFEKLRAAFSWDVAEKRGLHFAFLLPTSPATYYCSLSIECKVWPVAKHHFRETRRTTDFTLCSPNFVQSFIDFLLVIRFYEKYLLTSLFFYFQQRNFISLFEENLKDKFSFTSSVLPSFVFLISKRFCTKRWIGLIFRINKVESDSRRGRMFIGIL